VLLWLVILKRIVLEIEKSHFITEETLLNLAVNIIRPEIGGI
jgi:hypothetical protein